MTCEQCQVQIFDGELDSLAREHLAGCPECRGWEQEFRLNSGALAELREIQVPVQTVRRRWLAYAALAAAAMLAVAVGFYDGKEESITPSKGGLPVAPQVVEAVTPIPAPVFPGPPPDRPSPPARKAQVAKPRVEPRQAEPLLVKLLTDDPEIVIYWLIDPVQGEQAL